MDDMLQNLFNFRWNWIAVLCLSSSDIQHLPYQKFIYKDRVLEISQSAECILLIIYHVFLAEKKTKSLLDKFPIALESKWHKCCCTQRNIIAMKNL